MNIIYQTTYFFFLLSTFTTLFGLRSFIFPTIIVIKIGFCHSAVGHVKNHRYLHNQMPCFKLHFIYSGRFTSSIVQSPGTALL